MNEVEALLNGLRACVAQLMALGIDHETIEEAVDETLTSAERAQEVLRGIYGDG